MDDGMSVICLYLIFRNKLFYAKLMETRQKRAERSFLRRAVGFWQSLLHLMHAAC